MSFSISLIQNMLSAILLCQERGFVVPKGALLYPIGLLLCTAAPSALFVQIELLYICSFIRQQTPVAMNTAIAVQVMTRWIKCSKG